MLARALKPLLVAALLVLACDMVSGQETPPPAPIDRQQVQAELDRVTSATGLDDAVRAQVVKIYEEALAALTRVDEAQARRTEFEREAAGAPQQLQAIRKELERPPDPPVVDPPADASLATVEQELARATAELEAARARAAELQTEAARRSERRTQIPVELAAARAKLDENTQAIVTVPNATAPPEVVAARLVLDRARGLALGTEVAVMSAELASYDARQELLPARRDRTLRRVSSAEKLVEAWQSKVNERRAEKAKQDALEAARLQREAALRNPILQPFAAENEGLAALRTGDEGLSALIGSAARKTSSTRAQVTEMRRRFQSIKRRINASGLNRATGLILRREYMALPRIAQIKRDLHEVVRDLENIEYELVEREELRVGAGDIDRVAQELLGEIAAEGPAEIDSRLETAARELAAARRDLLDDLVNDSGTYRNTLLDLDQATRELLAATDTYAAYIEVRILGVRSFPLNRGPRLSELTRTVAWLTSASTWRHIAALTTADVRGRWPSTLVSGLGLVFAFGLSVWSRRRLRALVHLVGSYRTDAFRHTAEAVVLTIFAALPIPLVLLWVAWLLGRAPEQVNVGLAASSGLTAGGALLLSLGIVRVTLGSSGLAAAHFRWPVEGVRPIRRDLRWFIPSVVPLAAIVVGLDAHGDDPANATLGRLAFSAAMLLLLVFLSRVLRPARGSVSVYLLRHRGSWIDRLRYVWFALIIGIPVVLLIAAWLGYYYTALHLQLSFELTLMLIFALVVANGVLHRWLFIARRRVAIEDARRRREQALAHAADGTAGDLPAGEPAPFDEEKIDLPALSEQTRQLFRTAIVVSAVLGLFLVWAETLPALKMLDRIQLWPAVTVLDAPDTIVADPGAPTPPPGADGAASDTAASSPVPMAMPSNGGSSAPPAPAASSGAALSITVADLGLSLILLVATWVAFRNLPGLIEITVLQRLPLDSGSRYALSTVLRYAIAIVGVVVAFGALGISWSNLQWLAAALTFGLAFGLQEIFANFVSGLIILGERPFRVGDTVTVGAVTGTVTRIRMRATTVSDWDRKELVIPNKTFITGEVINWTLSDPVLRVKVPVGVSYGSDVDRVVRTLLKVAKAEPTVLDDPAPQALFLEFGDSTLNFEVRVFIPNIEHWMPVRHHLHLAITKAFRKADIEIAFPQRDLHIRSAGELTKLVERRSDLPASDVVNPA
jgi:potassium efflux system protein